MTLYIKVLFLKEKLLRCNTNRAGRELSGGMVVYACLLY